MHTLTLSNIHIPPGEAFIQGEQMLGFPSMRPLLEKVGCAIKASEPEITSSCGTQVVTTRSDVAFPQGSTYLKRPKEARSLTASGHKKKGTKPRREPWSLHNRKGQILVPGDESDFIITYYKKTEHTPMYFDRGVHEVEKDAN